MKNNTKTTPKQVKNSKDLFSPNGKVPFHKALPERRKEAFFVYPSAIKTSFLNKTFPRTGKKIFNRRNRS